jgi:CBS domain-containing protein
MNNSISSIMETTITTVDLDDTAEHVEEILDSNNLSCVPVIDSKGKLFGVISATDFVHFHQAHKNAKREHAWEICTHKTIDVSPEISIVEAGKLMVENNIHHLIVIENGEIKGIVSSIDLIKTAF